MLIITILALIVTIAGWIMARSTEPDIKKIGGVVRTLGILVTIVFALLTFATKSFRTVEAGHVGLEMQFGRVVGVRQPGGHFMSPVSDLVAYPTRLQAYSDSYSAGSRDMQTVNVKMLVNWMIDPTKVEEIYKGYGNVEAVQNRIITAACQETLKQQISLQPASDILKQRSVIKDTVQKALATWLAKYDIILKEVAIQDITFNDDYQKAIESKQVEEQNALKLSYTLQQEQKNAEIAEAKAKGEAASAIAKAKGDAESKRIQASADAEYNLKVAQSVTPLLIQLEKLKVEKARVEKWSGDVPQIMGSGSGMMFQMPLPGQKEQ